MKELLTGNTVLGIALQVLPFSLLACFLYMLFRIRDRKRRGRAVRAADEALRAVFALYCVSLFALLLTPMNFWSSLWRTLLYGGAEWDRWSLGSFNFVPTFWKVLQGEYAVNGWGWVGEMLTLNALMFAPMGLYLRFIMYRTEVARPVRYALAIPLAVELIQPLVGRSFDIDDLILNFLGFLLGYYLMSLFLLPFRRHAKSSKK